MSRTSALLRLAAAYGRHEVGRRFRRAQPGAARLLATYADDRLLPLTVAERDLLPEASGCISCGLCALVAARVSGLRPADLVPAYLRDYPRLALAAPDWANEEEPDAGLQAAADACPMGVPLPGVLAMVRRLATA